MIKNSHSKSSLALAAALALMACQARAAEDDSKLKVSGYFSLIGGSVVSGSMSGNYGPAQILGKDCPCFPADYSTASVYGSSATLGQETRGGIQAQYQLNAKTMLVGGLDAHASDRSLDLSSAYVKYSLTDSIDIQAGRQRIPLYYYSNLQSVGTIYPWVSPPAELYGWDATYYNGASVRYSGELGGGIRLGAQLFAGQEHVGSSSYYKFSYGNCTSVDWSSIVGGEIEASKGPVSVRVFHTQANVRVVNSGQGADDRSTFRALGIGAFYDDGKWLASAEATTTERAYLPEPILKVPSTAYSVGIGHRFGKWTPFISQHSYQERSSDAAAYDPVGNRRTSFTLRYDLDPNTALKLQFDRNRDSKMNYGGDANVIRFALDKMFF